jgi:hypothetical protein
MMSAGLTRNVSVLRWKDREESYPIGLVTGQVYKSLSKVGFQVLAAASMKMLSSGL